MGKLYGGILIHENWRNTKFNCIEELRKQEAEMEALEKAEALAAAELAAKEVMFNFDYLISLKFFTLDGVR